MLYVSLLHNANVRPTYFCPKAHIRGQREAQLLHPPPSSGRLHGAKLQAQLHLVDIFYDGIKAFYELGYI